MWRVKVLARELIDPSLRNTSMAYKWGSNQATHALMGLITAWLLASAGFFINGEYPQKESLFLVILFGYAAKELMFDGFNGWDTFNDILFYAGFGAGSGIVVFSEKSIGDWSPDVNPYSLTILLGVFISYWIAGTLARVGKNV